MSDSNIPLEAVLKLAVEQAGGEQVKSFLESYTGKLKDGEESVKRTNSALREMADHAGRLGDSLRGIGGLIGLGGAAAVAQQFMGVSGAGANVAMAEGHLTGGASTYGSYASALLGVQSTTGVPYTQLEEGLRTAAQMVGGNLSPQGAARFGALLAGASLASGMSPQAISSVMGSLMESTGTTAGYGTPQGVSDVTGLMAGVTQALTAFSGTQVGGMLPAVASVYESQALRAPGYGPHEGPAQTAGFMNALAQANPLFRQAKTAEAAIEGANSYLLSGLTNPMARFAEATAGVSTSEAIEGGPQAIEKLMGSMRQRLPGETYRDWLRSTFPAATAKMGEELANQPGLFREAHRKALEAAVNPDRSGYEYTLHHSLAAQTPEAELSKLGAQLLGAGMHVLMPLDQAIGPVPTMAAILAGGGALGIAGKAGLKAGVGALGAAGKGILGSLGVGSLEEGALSVGDIVAGASTAGLSVAAQALLFPESTGMSGSAAKNAAEQWRYQTVESAMKRAQHQYGGNWLAHTKQIEEEVRRYGAVKPGAEGPEFTHDASRSLHILHEALGVAGVPNVVKELEGKFGSEWYKERHGHEQKTLEAFVGKRLHGAGRQTLDEEVGKLRKYQELGPEGYWQMKFGESVGKFAQAVEKYMHGGSGHKNSAYEGGASQANTGYSPLSAALATHPGTVMAAYLGGAGSVPGTPGAGTATASYFTVAGHQNAWDQVLETYSGKEYGEHHGGNALAYVLKLAKEHAGGGAHPGDRRTVEADARKYGVPFNVLWGLYGAESSWGKASSNFGLTSQFPGSGTSGNFSTDARMAAEDLRALLRKIDKGISQMNRHHKMKSVIS